MTYGDLLNSEVCAKLMMVSFGTPQKNLQVYHFVNSTMDYRKYFENERSKLLDKYGELQEDGKYTIHGKDKIDEYNRKIDEILNMKIDGDLVDPGLSESDFSDMLCSYPNDKRFWLNASEIYQILSISKKIKSECTKN